ncbi:ferritin-2, chloroplastic [Tanacetum coccineum]
MKRTTITTDRNCEPSSPPLTTITIDRHLKASLRVKILEIFSSPVKSLVKAYCTVELLEDPFSSPVETRYFSSPVKSLVKASSRVKIQEIFFFTREEFNKMAIQGSLRSQVKRKKEHDEKFMEYQNKRSGKVKLQSILMSSSEFDHAEKGDALYVLSLLA